MIEQKFRGSGDDDVVFALLLAGIPGIDVLLVGIPEFFQQALCIVAGEEAVEGFLHGSLVDGLKAVMFQGGHAHGGQEPDEGRVLFEGIFQKIHGAVAVV